MHAKPRLKVNLIVEPGAPAAACEAACSRPRASRASGKPFFFFREPSSGDCCAVLRCRAYCMRRLGSVLPSLLNLFFFGLPIPLLRAAGSWLSVTRFGVPSPNAKTWLAGWLASCLSIRPLLHCNDCNSHANRTNRKRFGKSPLVPRLISTRTVSPPPKFGTFLCLPTLPRL